MKKLTLLSFHVREDDDDGGAKMRDGVPGTPP